MIKNELRNMIMKEINPYPVGLDLRMSDTVYGPVSMNEVMHYLAIFPVMPNPEPDRNDCDNYTFRMLGHLKICSMGAIGFAWSQTHSYVIFHDGNVLWVVESMDKNILTYRDALKDPFKRYDLRQFPWPWLQRPLVVI